MNKGTTTRRTGKGRVGRRAFLNSVATAALSLPYWVPARARGAAGRPGANDRLRIGVIGAGIRDKYHISNLPPEGQVVAVCVVLIAVGVGAGVMGRLFFRQPEIFMGVLSLVSTVVPFLLAIGTLLWIGLRSKPAWSTPICGECKGELRESRSARVTNRPECGAELTGPNAILYARVPGRRWGLVVWGGALLVTPIIGMVGMFVAHYFIGPSPGGLRGVGTQELIQKRLPKQIDEHHGPRS